MRSQHPLLGPSHLFFIISAASFSDQDREDGCQQRCTASGIRGASPEASTSIFLWERERRLRDAPQGPSVTLPVTYRTIHIHQIKSLILSKAWWHFHCYTFKIWISICLFLQCRDTSVYSAVSSSSDYIPPHKLTINWHHIDLIRGFECGAALAALLSWSRLYNFTQFVANL